MLNKPFHQITKDEAQAYLDFNAVPPVLWGHDHFSTLLYLETVCVDQGGNLQEDDRHMRTRSFVDESPPTRLQEDRLFPGHDDWNCLDDLMRAELLVERFDENGQLQLTDLGWRIAGALRRHKAEGKLLKDFPIMPFFEASTMWVLSAEYDVPQIGTLVDVIAVSPSYEDMEKRILPAILKDGYPEEGLFDCYCLMQYEIGKHESLLHPYARFDQYGRLIIHRSSVKVE